MDVPKEYHGREQSYLKHRILKEYAVAWGHKLGSVGRNVEAKVLGKEAAVVREAARQRADEARTGQMTLLDLAPPSRDGAFEAQHIPDLARAEVTVLEALSSGATTKFADLWPGVLESHHIKKSELGAVVWKMFKEDRLLVHNAREHARTVRDDDVLSVPTATA